MAFTGNHVCTSFRKELLEAKHDFTSHTFKLALYDEDATLNADTTDYSSTNEITGSGYSAGGMTLTVVSPSSGGGKGFTNFETLVIPSATLTARGGLIYNTTAGDGAGTTNAVLVLDFGGNRSAAGTNFTVTFPSTDAINAIIRI